MQEHGLWYFAYGSMCNPVSLQRRGLFPSASHPAVLAGYRLTFQLGGMANIVLDPDSSCQGVLHHVTQQEFAALREIESNYETLQVPVTTYEPITAAAANGINTHASKHLATATAAPAATLEVPARFPAAAHPEHDTAVNSTSAAGQPVSSHTVPANSEGHSNGCTAAGGPLPEGVVCVKQLTATTFIVMPAALTDMAQQHPEWGNALPSDRYIRIITAGLRHYGADPAWIDWVAAQPCKHGRQLHQYLKIPSCSITQQQQQQEDLRPQPEPDLPAFTLQQLSESTSQLKHHKAIFAIGPKVVQVDFSSKPAAPMVRIVEKHFAGRQVAFHMCMMLYEPRLPPISSPADLQLEHIEWAEDSTVEWMTGHNFPLQQIGWLEGAPGASRGPAGTADAEAGAGADAGVVQDAAEALHEEDEATAAPETGLFR